MEKVQSTGGSRLGMSMLRTDGRVPEPDATRFFFL